MVVVKCKLCGRKYQLYPEDNPNDYQCDCGGSLKSTERNLSKILLVVFLVIVSYLIGYLAMWMMDSINILG